MSIKKETSIKSKNDLLNLISQSFQTNLNIITYMEKSGFEINDNDWRALLNSNAPLNEAMRAETTEKKASEGNLYGLGFSEPKKSKNLNFRMDEEIVKLCRDEEVGAGLERVNSKIGVLEARIEALRLEIGDFGEDEIAGLMKLENPVEEAKEVDRKVRELDDHIVKLGEFEKDHLMSKNKFYEFSLFWS